ncbi:RsmB/NOP family class I SAM-dependent RNA methyltransferase [Celeribacter indicus]|uniref:Fmu (Sun) domain-containing protein n=1 Tax=Celeribacter indicus TaxID=1208324 RepID=A0A0B5E398_9RHOB|nr:RsmB/NOP family class I SAM-dependent RNA methyltransferase [Celeribacter indicus]AJE46912.1 Fmu (Sun) domain-containing protein [Celeribacter indicus]SDW78811.1 16S rRNA (cytosine967-C5)-methyltransferase [Celeribacter indicus]
MTPAARLSAAIDILDDVRAGENAERMLTSWARANRFAGSKDRAAIRDHVFDALRCRRSYGWLGGAGEGQASGRQLMLGALRAAQADPDALFCEARFAPPPLTAEERLPVPPLAGAPEGVRLDCPDWLLPLYRETLGAETAPVLEALRHRAALFLRVNRRKATLAYALEVLAADGIAAVPHPLSETALRVTRGARAVARSQAYLSGLVEIQDAGSQAIIDALPLEDGMAVLDYCAGGGGKALAMGARADLRLTAHDVDAARMQDIAPRASRAGIAIATARASGLSDRYDLVLCDVPCSGSGAFARSPQGKWALTPDRLGQLTRIQAQILAEVAPRLRPGGYLAYATCSLFRCENQERIAAFLAAQPDFTPVRDRLISPLEGGDGFYIAVLQKRL